MVTAAHVQGTIKHRDSIIHPQLLNILDAILYMVSVLKCEL